MRVQSSAAMSGDAYDSNSRPVTDGVLQDQAQEGARGRNRPGPIEIGAGQNDDPSAAPTDFVVQNEQEPSWCDCLRCVVDACWSFAGTRPGWAVLTLIMALITYAAVGPSACSDVARCSDHHHEIQATEPYSGYIAAALIVLLAHEVVSTCFLAKTERQAVHLVPALTHVWIPPALLCVTFAILLVENAMFHLADKPWYSNSSDLGSPELDGHPVYTMFYVEWLINVPILLYIAGRIALCRPQKELTAPLLMTNFYIVLAWSAHFTPNKALRYFLVAVSFILYFRASVMMCRWVQRWRKENPDGHMLGRPVPTVCLCIIFGSYGIVYFLRMDGVVSAKAERIFYTVMNFSTKLLISMILVGIRSSELRHVLLTMLAISRADFSGPVPA
eukprot:gb/GFBE01006757.1/.p1 GENE.gb/GFBE01006757.1/~~gb/GFBE01006757.1/.p1  ORF type:complete len:388 (+),score=26.92 gb/GFBE01006757.1/:1-1164(+)